MKKALSLLIAFAMLFSLGITANVAEKKELNIFMWSDYISDDLIADFEDEFGVRVNLSYMNDNADSITKLTAGAGSEYDLIMTCDAYMESLIAGATWKNWTSVRSPIPQTSTKPTGPNRTRATASPIS